jgi:hypothetical protein
MRSRPRAARDDAEGGLEALMLRAENLTVEVFIDEDDDGTRYAEAHALADLVDKLVPSLGQGR